MVPQHGRGAVGEAARTVMVTSLVIRTCSITRSERSGMMVIGSHWIWKTSRRRMYLVLQYTTCGISGPAEEPKIVLSLRFFRQGEDLFSCVVRKSFLIAILSSSPQRAYDFLSRDVYTPLMIPQVRFLHVSLAYLDLGYVSIPTFCSSSGQTLAPERTVEQIAEEKDCPGPHEDVADCKNSPRLAPLAGKPQD
jgi:hypothetical protein